MSSKKDVLEEVTVECLMRMLMDGVLIQKPIYMEGGFGAGIPDKIKAYEDHYLITRKGEL